MGSEMCIRDRGGGSVRLVELGGSAGLCSALLGSARLASPRLASARSAVSLDPFDVEGPFTQQDPKESTYQRQFASRANLHDESCSELWFVSVRRFSDTKFAYELPLQFFKTDFTFSPTIRCFKSELRVISGCRSKRPPYPRPEDFSIKWSFFK